MSEMGFQNAHVSIEISTRDQLMLESANLASAPDRLVVVGGDGQVSSSDDAAKSFAPVGTIGGSPSAFVGDDLYAALGDGTVVRSTDGGVGWVVRATP